MADDHDQLVADREQLIAKLRTALETFDRRDGELADEHDWRRAGVVSALQAVVKFLEANNVEQRLYLPLMEIWGAVQDVIDGRYNPLTTPASGQRRLQLKRALDRARAAAAVTILCNVGYPLDAALIEVARAANTDKDTLGTFRNNLLSASRSSRSSKRVPQEAIDHYLFVVETAGNDAEPILDLIRQRASIW